MQWEWLKDAAAPEQVKTEDNTGRLSVGVADFPEAPAPHPPVLGPLFLSQADDGSRFIHNEKFLCPSL